jgi:membrane associated rhomboid family serine protease
MSELSPAVHRGLLVAAFLLSAAVLVALARPRGSWGDRLRRRFVLGVPWGTLLTLGLVLAVYLFLQGGLDRWYDPLVIPFRAWSYFYPLGMLAGGLAHAGPGHLIGNLLGTIVFGTLAEYAWGHFPTTRGAQSFRSLREHPFARILAFPSGAAVAAVLGTLFGLGPVVGFSGVVFAFAGFALVRFPLATVVLLAAGDVVNLTYRALQHPELRTTVRPSFSPPWWAGVAIQGHALGVLTGLVAAAVLFRRRDELPSPAVLWLAVLAFGVERGLWAIYEFRGGDTYVLYRAAGLAVVFVMAALVGAAVFASRRTLVGAIDLSRREAAVGLLLAVALAVGLVAVPYNLLTVEETGIEDAEATVETGDYTVFYDEGIQHRLVAAYDTPFYNASGVTASGVIVTSRERGIWWEVLSKGALAFRGRETVPVGGVGWRETVVANRTGWSAVGGPTAYKVHLAAAGGERRLAYRSAPADAEPIVAGRNVTVEPADDRFQLVVSRNNSTLGRTPIPGPNATATAGDLRFVRENRTVYAVANETRVRIATMERYRGNR